MHIINIPLLLLLPTLISSQSSSGNRDGWRDDYKLGYSYDSLSEIGPLNWNEVPSTIGWGEWEVVRLASAQAETNANGLPLLDWDTNVNQCGTEARPSPIELMPSADCKDEEEIRVRPYNPERDCRHPLEEDNRRQAEDATDQWEITPYSLRYYYPRTDRVCRRPTVRLFGVGNANKKNQEEHFVLQWLEVHARSEHVVAGKRYDAEIQMVHVSTSRENELAIVSVLVDAGATEDHVDFQRFLLDGWQRRALQETAQCDNRRELVRNKPHLRGDRRSSGGGFTSVLQDYPQPKFNASLYDEEPQRILQGGNNRCSPDKYGNGCQEQGIGPRKRMFPYNLWPSVWYFSYEGSIAAPPCQGNVHWRIMDTPLTISRRQYKQLVDLLTQSRDERCRLDSATNLQGENFRPLQNATLSSGGNNKQKDGEFFVAGAPQTVKHCTEENFVVDVFEGEDQ